MIQINSLNDNIPSELLTESNLYVIPSSITENSAIVTINAYPWSYGSSIYYDYRGSVRVTFNTIYETISNQNLDTQVDEVPIKKSKINNTSVSSKFGEASQIDLEDGGPSVISNHIQKDGDDELHELIDEANSVVIVNNFMLINNRPLINMLNNENIQNNLINIGNINNNSRINIKKLLKNI